MRTSGTRRPWMLAAVGIVVLNAVALMAIFLSPRDDGDTRSSGQETAVHGEFHEFVEVVRVAGEQKGESWPDPGAMELNGNVAYVAYHTDTNIHVTAIGLGEEGRWTKRVSSPDSVEMVSLVATPAALMVVASYRQATGMSFYVVALDLFTGAVKGKVDDTPTHFIGDFMLTRRGDGTHNAYDIATFAKAWSVPATGDAYQFVLDEGWNLVAVPDDRRPHGGIVVSPNDAEDQYVLQADLATGEAHVLDLETGAVRTEGNLGDVDNVVAVRDTIYARSEKADTLTAYAADDLATVRWRVSVPSNDNGRMWTCGPAVLCVSMRTRTGHALIGIDANTGQRRWRSDRYGAGDVRQAGEYIAARRGGVVDILDSVTGEVHRTVTAPALAYTGGGVLITGTAQKVIASRPSTNESVLLGPAPDPAVVEGECEWNRTVALCASEKEYVVFRYRS